MQKFFVSLVVIYLLMILFQPTENLSSNNNFHQSEQVQEIYFNDDDLVTKQNTKLNYVLFAGDLFLCLVFIGSIYFFIRKKKRTEI